ncbi:MULTISPECIES: hypothetical protein [Lacrimispora]|nr:hypothetical protein [Lacrimispora amygdalina]MDK2964611.1 hypothetical protein [Lacrimispora sp.]
MGVITVLLMALYVVIGGLTTLYLLFSFPAVIVWKFYRKFKNGISLFR